MGAQERREYERRAVRHDKTAARRDQSPELLRRVHKNSGTRKRRRLQFLLSVRRFFMRLELTQRKQRMQRGKAATKLRRAQRARRTLLARPPSSTCPFRRLRGPQRIKASACVRVKRFSHRRFQFESVFIQRRLWTLMRKHARLTLVILATVLGPTVTYAGGAVTLTSPTIPATVGVDSYRGEKDSYSSFDTTSFDRRVSAFFDNHAAYSSSGATAHLVLNVTDQEIRSVFEGNCVARGTRYESERA